VIRLSWLQFRTQAAAAFAAVAALAIVLAITGHNLAHLYDVGGLATCTAHGDCATLDNTFLRHYSFLRNVLGPAMLAIPALIGVFWGAPLVARELETGTYRLAWTQSVTRTRWLAIKVALVGIASIAAAGLFSLMITWWFRPIDKVNMNGASSLSVNRFAPGAFSERDIVPFGYAAFAFAVGLTAGLLLRRTLPAMATTLVAFVGARFAMTYWIRPHLIAPAHTTATLSSASNLGFEANAPGQPVTFVAGPPNIANAWVYSDRIVDKAGRAVPSQSLNEFLLRACPHIATPPQATPLGVRGGPGSPVDFQACITKLSAKFHEVVTFQPASRYWAFQSYETAIFLVGALILVGFCAWWIRRLA
jgi:hypothetical protein